MEIISERRRVECSERRHEYSWADCPGAGFSFEVDENGMPIKMTCEAAWENWRDCQTNPKIIDNGIVVRKLSYDEPRIGRCNCGREVALEHFTNTCDCGADYNSSGQRLAPREQWGEETGESLGDILRIP